MIRSTHSARQQRGPDRGEGNGLADHLRSLIVGQDDAISAVVPYVEMYAAGLSPEGRPAGVFLLLGPTGTGKTRTVEALAQVLHGSERNVLRIDCGEFQLDHEVAKLIGAPPGYLGHRETTPMLNQQRLNAVASQECGLSVVLFDEVEKAAPSLGRLLLGVLDKATLKLGDNTSVDFQNSLIFLTSNLGAKEMLSELQNRFGFGAMVASDPEAMMRKLENVALAAVRKRFSPEFVNRIDCTVTYRPLDRDSLEEILDLQIESLESHIRRRLAARAFSIELEPSARSLILEAGTSPQYGARELKRVIHRRLVQPLASMMLKGYVEPGSVVRFSADPASDALRFETMPAERVRTARRQKALLEAAKAELAAIRKAAQADRLAHRNEQV